MFDYCILVCNTIHRAKQATPNFRGQDAMTSQKTYLLEGIESEKRAKAIAHRYVICDPSNRTAIVGFCPKSNRYTVEQTSLIAS